VSSLSDVLQSQDRPRQRQLGRPGSAVSEENLDTREDPFASELTKLVLIDTLRFLRTQAQSLQAITGLFMTAHVALLVGIWKQQEVTH
jgi:hypothetical protein